MNNNLKNKSRFIPRYPYIYEDENNILIFPAERIYGTVHIIEPYKNNIIKNEEENILKGLEIISRIIANIESNKDKGGLNNNE